MQRLLFGVGEKLYDRRFPFAVLDLDERESFRAVQLCNFRKFVGLADRDSGKAFRVDRFHHATGVERAAKNFETAVAKNFPKIDQLHFKTTIRFVAAISGDCLAIGQAIKRCLDIYVQRCFENCGQHSLSDCENIVRCNE